MESSITPLTVNKKPFYKKTNYLFEDHLGFLWIATTNGLYKYDGYGVEEFQYNVFNQTSIPNNNINSITEDVYGNLWMGSESYLVSYDLSKNLFKGYYRDKTSKVLGQSSDGTIWAFVQKTGIIKITPNKNPEKAFLESKFNYKGSKSLYNATNQVNEYLEDQYKRNWFATSKGIIALDSALNTVKSTFKKNTISIKKGKNNTIIAATKNEVYILRYKKSDFKLEIIEHYTEKNFPRHKNWNQAINTLISEEDGNTLWLGTTNGLLKGCRINNIYQFSLYKDSSNLISHINTFTFDNFNNLWIGSQRGVGKLIGKTPIFKHYPTAKAYSNTFASPIFVEKKNQILIGFRDFGILRYSLKNNKSEPFIKSANDIGFIKLNYTKKELLIGTGRYLFETKNYSKNTFYPTLDTLKIYSKPVRDAIPINNNELWIGLWGGGIDIINKNNPITDFSKKVISTLTNDNVFVMYLDKSQNIWIGTRGNGLFKVDLIDENIKHFPPNLNGGLSSNAILCINENKQGDIWIGTRGGGLNLISKTENTIQSFGKKDGLLSTTISGIEIDTDDNLWLSTDEGISFFDAKLKKIKNFGSDDGIKESQFSFNSNDKINNTIFFGALGGFYKINCGNFNKTDLIPNTVITDFSIFGDESNGTSIYDDNQLIKNKLRQNETISLAHHQNNIVFNFSSLDFTSPNKNKYAYILEGVNNFWVYTDAFNRNANYNNLPPGDYTFKVKGSNSDGIWNETPARIKFSITPPFWKSNSAVALYALLSLILIWITIYLIRKWYRLKKNLVAETVSRQKDNEYHKMRMVFFTDISHELRTPLTLIKGTIEKVINDNNFTLNTLSVNRIQNNVIRMNRLISQIMDIRKHDAGEFKININKNNVVDDLTKIKNAFNDLAKVNKIDYTFNSQIKNPKGYYDILFIEKILFNLLSNAFKYTPEKGKITLFAEILNLEDLPNKINKKFDKGRYLKCMVIDSGTGISKKDLPFIFDRFYQSTTLPTNQIPGTGIGMELVHKLITMHKGYIEVNSEEHKFTEFSLYIPIDKKHYSKKELLNNKKNTNTVSKLYIESTESDDGITFNYETEPTNQTGKPKILIIEDNQEIINLIKEGLYKDFQIITAKNGKLGYDSIIKNKPELILSDILMPVEDGVSMLKRIKENKDISHIPIFMLSARGFDETKIKCIRLGADDFIEKPFSLEFIKWKIKNNIRKRGDLKETYSRIITVNPSEIEIESTDDKFIRKVVKIIEDAIDDDLLNVEYLASEVGMSRANLYRKLQAIANQTPVEFIKKIRLKRATQLLTNKGLYVSEVAHMTGFNNLKYFSKCFKKEYGITPSQFMNEETLVK